MRFLDIAIKDLYQIFKDWKPAIFLLAAPILFTLMFGFMFGGFSGPGGNAADDRLPVLIEYENETSLTESFISYLGTSDVIRVEKNMNGSNLETLKTAVDSEDYAAVILISEDFSQTIHQEGKVSLDLILDENSPAGITVKQAIQTAINHLQTAAQAASLVVKSYSEKVGFENPGESETLYDEAFNQSLSAWHNPPVTPLVTQTSIEGSEETSEENAFAQSLPGMMAQFAIAGLIGAAEIIVQERKSGALDRLSGTTVLPFEILAGHWLAMFAMIFLQFIILISFGQIFLRLNFFSAPWATLILSITSCAFVASLGLLIGILAKMPEQTAIYALIPMFVFSGLGGAWMPLEFVGETVQKASRFSPVSWIMTGYKGILLRGDGLQQIGLNVLILAGFAILFFIPAAVIFYRNRT